MSRHILFFIITCICMAYSHAAPNDTKWVNHIIGNSTHTVYSICQTEERMMWLGTNHGLFYFDGHRTQKIENANYRQFKDLQIHHILQKERMLFLATNNGLLTYNLDDGELHKIEGNVPMEIRDLAFNSGKIWLGSLFGLYSLNPSSMELKKVEANLPHQAVYSLLPVSDDCLLIGTYDGLVKYFPSSGKSATVPLPVPASHENVFVNSLCLSHNKNTVWIGTEGALFSLDLNNGAVRENMLARGHSVKSISEMEDGTMAVGTDNGIYTGYPSSLSLHRHDSRDSESLTNNIVWSVFTDRQCIIAGTENGISITSTKDSSFWVPLSKLTSDGEGNQIFNIFRDDKKRLWLGGSNGLVCLGADKIQRFNLQASGDVKYLSHNRVRDIYQSSQSVIWVATDGGVNRFDEASGQFINYRIHDKEKKLHANWVYNIIHDNNDDLWIGSYLGGILAAPISDFFSPNHEITAKKVISEKNGLSNPFVSRLINDRKDNKWVLEFRDSVVIRIDGKTNQLTRIDIQKLLDDYPVLLSSLSSGEIVCAAKEGIVALSEDGKMIGKGLFPYNKKGEILSMGEVKGEIWLSTTDGLWSWSPGSSELQLLPLPNKQYTSVYYDPLTQHAFLGSIDGFQEVDPASLSKMGVTSLPRLINVNVDGNPLFQFPLSPDKIEIPRDHRNIEVIISALEYDINFPVRYAYRTLEQNKGEWILLPEGENSIMLSNLHYGKHHLEVKLAVGDGKVLEITMNVPAPWYLSGWAFCIYGLAFVIIAFLVALFLKRREKQKDMARQRARIMAMVQNRMDFFSDMSHELKTPLSLIVGPVSRLRNKVESQEIKKQLDEIYDNTLKLNALVHRVVDINNTERDGDRLLIFSRVDIVEFCRSIVRAYAEINLDKKVIFECSEKELLIDTDVVKLESIVTNLISNACKYSEANGEIVCRVERNAESVNLIVEDNGMGIPSSQHALVFQRMFRSPNTSKRREGTGIGLYLVKRYVELLNGKITLESEENVGSKFTVSFPAGSLKREGPVNTTFSEISSKEGKTILIVDDNEGIRDFLTNVFRDEGFCILRASDGQEALDKARELHPDIIISDEVMPRLSGIGLCKALREEKDFKDIPFILVTGKNDGSTERESIMAGVDLCVSKPFDVPVLIEKVRRCYENRYSVAKQETSSANIMPLHVLNTDDVPESLDEKNLSRVTEVIEQNLADPDLNVTFICSQTGMHSKQLYRLVKKYLDITPVEYIRKVRLRKAAFLLEQNKFTVSEVMYMVGFSSSSYFAKCFSAAYGVTPSAYNSAN